MANDGTYPEYDGEVSVLLSQSSAPGDLDDDVDLADFAAFQISFDGPE